MAYDEFPKNVQAISASKAGAASKTEAALKIEAAPRGEIADFAKTVNTLLDQLRQLIKDNREREAEIHRAQTKALQNQINAHFIYNVLEAIKMMAEIDEKYEISDSVTSLGKLLRYSMKFNEENVELEWEIDYVKNYIDLMNLRFDYVITLDVDVPEEILKQRIPKITLQPIVENAVLHGAASLACDSTINLCGKVDIEHGRFTISVMNEGAGMDKEALEQLKRQISGEETKKSRSSSGNGIGLKNIHDRIRLAFGDDYGLRVDSRIGFGTTVSVDLPYSDSKG